MSSISRRTRKTRHNITNIPAKPDRTSGKLSNASQQLSAGNKAEQREWRCYATLIRLHMECNWCWRQSVWWAREKKKSINRNYYSPRRFPSSTHHNPDNILTYIFSLSLSYMCVHDSNVESNLIKIFRKIIFTRLALIMNDIQHRLQLTCVWRRERVVKNRRMDNVNVRCQRMYYPSVRATTQFTRPNIDSNSEEQQRVEREIFAFSVL